MSRSRTMNKRNAKETKVPIPTLQQVYFMYILHFELAK